MGHSQPRSDLTVHCRLSCAETHMGLCWETSQAARTELVTPVQGGRGGLPRGRHETYNTLHPPHSPPHTNVLVDLLRTSVEAVRARSVDWTVYLFYL